MRIQPGDPLEAPSQRLAVTVAKGYQRYKEKRAELRDIDVFPQSLLYVLDPFENQYQDELKAGKTTG
jgi:hypothetical protein